LIVTHYNKTVYLGDQQYGENRPKPQTKGKGSGDAERDIKEAVAKVKKKVTRNDAINAKLWAPKCVKQSPSCETG